MIDYGLIDYGSLSVVDDEQMGDGSKDEWMRLIDGLINMID